MSAGRDVEELISSWLVEEAASGAPDRVLESTRHVVIRTKQRRFAAIWRQEMFSPIRALAMTAALVVALIGGAFVGRVTAPTDPGAAAPSPGPSVSAIGPSLAEYRTARSAICGNYVAQIGSVAGKSDGVFSAATAEADRPAKFQAMTQVVTLSEALAEELGALQAPPQLVAEHAANVSDLQAINSIYRNALRLVERGDFVGAHALDLATNPLFDKFRRFETRNSLVGCP
jgi:hypothetical protein